MLKYYTYLGDLFPIYHHYNDYPVERKKFRSVTSGRLTFDLNRQGFVDDRQNFHARIKILESSSIGDDFQECSLLIDYTLTQDFPSGLAFYCYFGKTTGLCRSTHSNNHGVYEVGDLVGSKTYKIEIKAMGDPFIPHDFTSEKSGGIILGNQLWIAHAGSRAIEEVWLSIERERERLFLIFTYIMKPE